MTRASFAAAFAASLSFGSMSVANAADGGLPVADGRVAEERLLGSADEEAQYLACQPFTREIAASGMVAHSLDAALAEAGVPAAALLEARQALATSLDVGRDIGTGDRFYVRYQQTFTAEGTPIGVGRVLWAELRTKAKGTIALHRFRPQGGAERLWLASGEAATPPSMRLPLDTMTVSSGYGLRADPLDKPTGPALAMGPLPDPAKSVPAAYVAVPAPAPEPPAVAPPEPAKPARRRDVFSGQPGFGGFSMNSRPALDGAELQRLVAERDAEARRAAAARPVDVPPTRRRRHSRPPLPRRCRGASCGRCSCMTVSISSPRPARRCTPRPTAS